MTTIAQCALFLSSYSPLFAVFALLDNFGGGIPSWICLGLALLGPLLLCAMLRVAHRLSPQGLHVGTSQIRDGDAMAYIATYLVPFAAVAATTPRERGALAIFVLLIAVLYIRSELFYVNPLLALVGYRLFQVSTRGDSSAVLITHRRFLPPDIDLNARRLSDYVYWEAKR